MSRGDPSHDLVEHRSRRRAMRRTVDRSRPARVLVVEDNPDDVRLLREALSAGQVEVEIEIACDGEEAVEVLTRSIGDPQLRPDLVLLDLNLPRKTGSEVLAEVKVNPALRQIPIIVLSGSAADEDIREAYDLHANAYMRKPRDFPALRGLVAEIERFWLEQALLPI
jgi:chemotaxis family two-component system response regulator Rcp1